MRDTRDATTFHGGRASAVSIGLLGLAFLLAWLVLTPGAGAAETPDETITGVTPREGEVETPDETITGATPREEARPMGRTRPELVPANTRS